MTSSNHSSGTDRIREAVDKLDLNVDVIINVQGDEPFIDPNQISSLMSVFKSDSSTQIATLVRKFDPADGFESLFDPNLVKVAVSDNHEALYFSRSIIPYVRTVKYTEWLSTAEFYTHIGIYAYRTDTLRRITSLPRASLEVAESLEQLRWLQNGYPVKVAETDVKTIGIDTPDDLKAAEEFLSKISD
jgi:3-deoxy-manno-octulosonate cytidylyltransferase (CMP-KDO synthetase)